MVSSDAALRARNDALEEQVRHLRALLVPHIRLPGRWGIPGAQERCLRALLGRSPHVTTHDVLHQACTPQARWDDPLDVNTLKVHVCRLRKAIDRLVPGARIRTVYGDGYELDARSATLIREAIARDLSGPVAEAA